MPLPHPLDALDKQIITQALLARSPYVKQAFVNLYTLGGADKASIGITIGFDDKSTWASGIFDNSAHRKFMLDTDGTLEELTGYKTLRFRKCKVKSVEDAISKLVKWSMEAKS
jgi:hypothetical protein